jgi:hypothetical protein
MMARLILKKAFPGRTGMMQPGSYAIPADISMGDAKAARADGYGMIERGDPPADLLPTPTPGGAAPAAAMFSPAGGAPEHKEQDKRPARSLTTRKRRDGSPS